LPHDFSDRTSPDYKEQGFENLELSRMEIKVLIRAAMRRGKLLALDRVVGGR